MRVIKTSMWVGKLIHALILEPHDYEFSFGISLISSSVLFLASVATVLAIKNTKSKFIKVMFVIVQTFYTIALVSTVSQII